MRKRQAYAGFTLIELLIVIAIIGILAAVMIPNLIGARRHAYDSISQSCANSLAKAAGLYKIDNMTSTTYPAASVFTAAPDEYGTQTCLEPNLHISGGAAASFSYTVYHSSGFKQFTVSENGITSTPLP